MFSPDQYELLDFGGGRKLERFGPLVLDRPAPAADGLPISQPELWGQADGRFERTSGDSGRWKWRGDPPSSWVIEHGKIKFQLKPTDFGHVGLFPEQAQNWDWISSKVRRRGEC